MLADILHYASVYGEHTLEKGVERRNARIDASLIVMSLSLTLCISVVDADCQNWCLFIVQAEHVLHDKRTLDLSRV